MPERDQEQSYGVNVINLTADPNLKWSIIWAKTKIQGYVVLNSTNLVKIS